MSDVKSYVVTFEGDGQADYQKGESALSDYFNKAGKGKISYFFSTLGCATVSIDNHQVSEIAQLECVEGIELEPEYGIFGW